MVDMMAVTFEDQMSQQSNISDIQQTRHEVDLGPFTGTELEFVITHSAGLTIRQYIFVLHDGNRAWNGQLSANSTQDISRARMIMKSAQSTTNEAIERTRE